MSKLIEFVYPDYIGEEPDPERIEYAVNYLINRFKNRSQQTHKTYEKYTAVLTRHLLKGESISNIAKELNVTKQRLYQIRSKLKRIMTHRSIRNIIFDDEYFEKIKAKTDPNPKESPTELELLMNSLNPRARGLLKLIITRVLHIPMHEAKIMPNIIKRVNDVPPDVFVRQNGYGEISVNDLMSHIGRQYMSIWWPELEYDPNINMHSLCIEWFVLHKDEIEERNAKERQRRYEEMSRYISPYSGAASLTGVLRRRMM